MTGLEKGRDEQSVSGNPHLKFGLVGAFRLPKSAVEASLMTDVPPMDDERGSPPQVDQVPIGDELAEYEPSIPDEGDPPELFPEVFQGPVAHAVSGPESLEHADNLGPAEQEESHGKELDLDERIKDLTSGVELVSLRYLVGLKSKTGQDVTAGLQRLILNITRRFPVKVLHCDPGTEFGSDKLSTWLSQQGITLQTTIPTDKQGNGVAERTVGWMKARARTLLSSTGAPAALWPLAMRYAAECHNRQVLRMAPLPAFGQSVLHKLKRPSGATKELMVRWVTATYAAPHLTIPDGHVLITKEGNLVASKGFRTNLVDVSMEPDLSLPVLQAEEVLDQPLEVDSKDIASESSPHIPPSRRLKEKTSVRGLRFCDDREAYPDQLSQIALLDEDYTDSAIREILTQLEGTEQPSDDRRGEFVGRYVLGAYCHGGQRGVTSLARKYPAMVRLLNKVLMSRLPSRVSKEVAKWSSVMLMHASEVPVHRDYRNEWGTHNIVVRIAGQHELWLGPPRVSAKSATVPEPVWDSQDVRMLGPQAVLFDPRSYHAVRHTPDWLIVGYSPLGIHKVPDDDRQYLCDLGFPLPEIQTDQLQVKAFKAASSGAQSSSDQHGSSGRERPASASESYELDQDLQEDSYTPIVGWDPTRGGSLNTPQYNLEEADMYQYLCEREVEWTFRRLTFLGVESPADLEVLYVEDLLEFGIPLEDAQKIMVGIHPAGTVRPDNPNGISLTTGEVCLFDRSHRQIPRVLQNRTLSHQAPGPPLPGLGVVGPQQAPDPYVEDWEVLQGEVHPQPQLPPEPLHAPDLGSPRRSIITPPEVSAVFSEEFSLPQGMESRSSSSVETPRHYRAETQGEIAWNSDIDALHAMRMQAIWEAEDEEQFRALTGVTQSTVSEGDGHPCTSVREPEDVREPAEVPTVFSEEFSPPHGRSDYECKVVTLQSHEPMSRRSAVSHQSQIPYQGQDTNPGRISETLGFPQIGVPIPAVMSLNPTHGSLQDLRSNREPPVPRIKRVEESSFTPDIESILESLTGPLEVVHQVSPHDVKGNMERWKPAAQEEVDSMESMGAIIRRTGSDAKALLRLPNVEVLPSKGVFTVKPGKPYRRKVRVVSCGNFAKGVSEDVLYASGAAAEVLRILLIHAGGRRRQCWSTDIKCAFLLAPIPETVQKIYVLRPPTILTTLGICTPDEYWEVRKAVYGFKESPKWWSQYRDNELGQAVFQTSQGLARLSKTKCDENLWEISLEGGVNIGHVLVYVDDLLILSNQGTAEAFHAWVRSKWGCSDLERATASKALRFLGVDIYEVCDDSGTLGYTLSQEGYIDELVRSHELTQNTRAIVPLPKEWIKTAPEEEKGYDPAVLRDAQRVTGELLWISQRTRVDICFSVGLMSSWVTRAPGFVIRVGLRVLAYLANTKTFRLSLVPDDSDTLTVYTDASFAPFSERSISGIVVMMNNKCVFWKSRRQTLVSLSTAECELIAAVEGVVLGQSVQTVATELWQGSVRKILYVDNLAAITLAEGGGTQRTRHLRVRACFLKEMIDNGRLQVLHCPGETQLADMLTKALPAPRLVFLNDLLGIGPPPMIDPVVQAVMSTSRSLHQVNPSEGYNVLLMLALTMIQVTPATSQEEEQQSEALSLDLYILGAMMAFSILFIWEIGKHCLRECNRSKPDEPAVASVLADDTEHRLRRSRRHEAVRRAVERELDEGLRQRSNIATPSEPERSASPPPPPAVQASSHVHLHMSAAAPTEGAPAHEAFSPPRPNHHWTLASSSTEIPRIPPPPPLPVVEVNRGGFVRESQTLKEAATQTDFPVGLSHVQLCEYEMITTNSRTPGALHLFPQCHALRNVAGTSRRMICRYCLQTLRERGAG